MGLTHFDEAPSREYALGHLRNRWTMLGEAAGCEAAGVRRIQIEPGGWSTPAHEHGRSEEIFYVLEGSGLSWQRGRTAPIRAGDCIVYLPRRGPHTLYAEEALDALAFGTRAYDEATRLPRLGISTLGGRAVESVAGPADGTPIQFVRESEIGPPELPGEPGPRPARIVNVDETIPVAPGHVIARPAGTGVAHALRAESELTCLAYGTREPGDARYYPRSGKIAWRGPGVVARVAQVDYWDGED